ncbi:hypothetical protein BOV94_12545 [Solemya velum gill symbiont]|uniref:hypothetical protein n=1 Tax=Solemya velum gill symbiont TaxID=2340 RepID=UPI000995E54D|nr:hypothetical protein [Solemya velum gill symbiont]OOY49073.1 hypothetical protein BOV94_12545 [Solemya velum gill symbiont]
MAQSKILVDTNSYIRLAKSIHPLLDVIFGEENYCLYVLKELDIEFSKNRRLTTQYAWVDEDEFFNNRKKKLTLSKKNKREIEIAVDFLNEEKITNTLSVSDVDILYLAYGLILSIPVVTDDTDMLNLAETYGITTMKSLDLMHTMLTSEHIDMQKIRQVVAYWEYISDKPAEFRKDYIRLFSEDPP